MENTEKKPGWSVELTSEWPFIKFDAFDDAEPTINKKPISLLSKNGKISQPKAAVKPTPKAQVNTPKPKADKPQAPAPEPAPSPEIRIIEYSEKGIAVVGNIDSIREKLIAAYGSPKTFVHDGQRYQGIAFSKKRRNAVVEIIAG